MHDRGAVSRNDQKPVLRLNIRQREALELLAPAGTKAAKEDMAGAMSAFPWRINGTGRAIRTETLRQLERRGLVALADGEYRITDAGRQAACQI
jgi:ribosomal protein S19E (S16A)